MCGIAGVHGGSGNEDLVRRMLDALRHRGPDDEGVHASGPACLGNRRLSIIDLPGGHQPMSNEDGSIWVVFNGEIYNHAALRDGLAPRHRFATKSDTEVLVHLYEDKGPAFLNDLIGMFALAVYDARDGSLFLARDRLGKKPLVYCRDGDRLLFASEIKALLSDERLPRRLDPIALQYYLAYLYVPAPWTMFEGIRKLPPGHWARWHRGRLQVERYWQPEPAALAEADRDEQIRALIDESVRLRLVGDVPVAGFLSGGIDSTVVTSIAASHVPRLQTISVGFEEASHDELPFARLVAKKLGTRHTEIVVRPDAAGMIRTLADTYDEPFGDSSALPTYLLCREAARHAKVALSGDGGDECFAGYPRHAAMAQLSLVRKTPRAVATLVSRILPIGRKPSRTLSRLSRMLTMLKQPAGEIYRHLVTFLSDEDRAALTGRKEDVASFILDSFGPGDPVNGAARADLLTYLPGDLLVKMDIASMAHSLEVRAPLLDHRLVNLALAIPGSVKIRGMTTKHYFRRLYADLIPPELARRRKQGFAIPLKAWLGRELRPIVDGALLDSHPRYAPFLDPIGVRRLVDQHRAGRADFAEVIWALVMFELWARRFNIGA